MFDFLSKIFFWKEPPRIIIVTGASRALTSEAIFRVLSPHFKVKKIPDTSKSAPFFQFIDSEILILESDIKKADDFRALLTESSILAVSHLGEFHPDREVFAGDLEEANEIIKLAEMLPGPAHLVLNFDDETVRDIKNNSPAHPLTFGFGARADLRASDFVAMSHPSRGTNFKINYRGNIVPIWLNNLFGKENIYAALAASAVGSILNLNLVEISESLKNYQGLPGKMKLIGGIKNSWILDNSGASNISSLIEALEILGKIESKRQIAVLGDVVGLGKYTIEAHEAIGEKANKCDLLFTVGDRAKFIAEGAVSRGMPRDKIFYFDAAAQAAKAIQDEMREEDLVLVGGSKEMGMEKIIEEIKE